MLVVQISYTSCWSTLGMSSLVMLRLNGTPLNISRVF